MLGLTNDDVLIYMVIDFKLHFFKTDSIFFHFWLHFNKI